MFNYKLKFIRERNGYKQTEIADLLNINKTTYSNYESEKYIIPLKYLVAISDYLNVSIDYIFGLNNKINYKNSKKDINLVIFRERFIYLRKRLKLSQESFARVLNNKRTNISGYELGKYIIPTELLYTICKKYHISADYLLGKIDSPKYLD